MGLFNKGKETSSLKEVLLMKKSDVNCLKDANTLVLVLEHDGSNPRYNEIKGISIMQKKGRNVVDEFHVKLKSRDSLKTPNGLNRGEVSPTATMEKLIHMMKGKYILCHDKNVEVDGFLRYFYKRIFGIDIHKVIEGCFDINDVMEHVFRKKLTLDELAEEMKYSFKTYDISEVCDLYSKVHSLIASNVSSMSIPSVTPLVTSMPNYREMLKEKVVATTPPTKKEVMISKEEPNVASVVKEPTIVQNTLSIPVYESEISILERKRPEKQYTCGASTSHRNNTVISDESNDYTNKLVIKNLFHSKVISGEHTYERLYIDTDKGKCYYDINAGGFYNKTIPTSPNMDLLAVKLLKREGCSNILEVVAKYPAFEKVIEKAHK